MPTTYTDLSGNTATLYWEEDGTSSTATNTWLRWNLVDSTASTCASYINATCSTVWRAWSIQGTTVTGFHYGPAEKAREYTKEELEQEAEQARERAEKERLRREEAERKLKRAKQRAKKLLLQNLNLRQKLSLSREKKIRVQGSEGGLYELREGWAGNVEELNGEFKPFNRLCIHPNQQVPIHDNILAQKLMLETDEKSFRRTANHTKLNPSTGIPCYN